MNEYDNSGFFVVGVFAVAYETFVVPFIRMKNKLIAEYNSLFNLKKKINPKALYKINEDHNEIYGMAHLEGDIFALVFKDSISIRNIKTFDLIKTHKLNYFSYDSISNIIFFSPKECILSIEVGQALSFLYIQFDENYDIIKSFYKHEKIISVRGRGIIQLKLKNEDFAIISYYERYRKQNERNIIYIFTLNKTQNEITLKNNKFIESRFFIDIKNKDEYLTCIENDYISIIDSNNLESKKTFRFNYSDSDDVYLLNDKYIIHHSFENCIFLYNLENFQELKRYFFKYNKLIEISRIENNKFFAFESLDLERISEEKYIKEYVYDEEKNEIVCTGIIELGIDKEVHGIIKNNDNYYLLNCLKNENETCYEMSEFKEKIDVQV